MQKFNEVCKNGTFAAFKKKKKKSRAEKFERPETSGQQDVTVKKIKVALETWRRRICFVRCSDTKDIRSLLPPPFPSFPAFFPPPPRRGKKSVQCKVSLVFLSRVLLLRRSTSPKSSPCLSRLLWLDPRGARTIRQVSRTATALEGGEVDGVCKFPRLAAGPARARHGAQGRDELRAPIHSTP